MSLLDTPGLTASSLKGLLLTAAPGRLVSRPPVCCSGWAPSQYLNGFGGYTWVATQNLLANTTSLQFVFPLGWATSPTSTPISASSSAIVIKAGFTVYNGGATVQVTTPIAITFNGGATTATCQPFGTVISDPIPFSASASPNVFITTRTYVTATDPAFMPAGNSSGATGGATTGDGYIAGDHAMDATGVSNANSGRGFGPLVLGDFASPTVCLVGIGDSITVGQGDSASPTGYFMRMVNNTTPAIRIAVAAMTADQMISNDAAFGLLSGITHATVMMGTNDIAAGRTAAQAKVSLAVIYKRLRARGIRAYGLTIPPKTTSTDAWATLGNQTSVAGYEPGGHRSVVNAWIRAGADTLLDGFFDTALGVETGVDTNRWISSTVMTADGVHPNNAGHAAVAARIDRTVFTV